MQLNVNLPNWLQIPLKIFLPAVWLVSGALLLMPVDWRVKLYLDQWCNQYGFYIGLSFLISSALVALYVLYFAKNIIGFGFYKLTYKKRWVKKVMDLNYAEQGVVLTLYHSNECTASFDYNQPIIKSLLARGFIYSGSSQVVTGSLYRDGLPILYTLQPEVYQALEYDQIKLEKKIKRLDKKLKREKISAFKKRLNDKCEYWKREYEAFYGGRGLYR